MSSLEGAESIPVVDASTIKAEATPEKDLSKNDDSEKTNDKEPETPVTEPLTNGSSAPETPKEEVRQNGDAASVEEQPSPAESIPEVVAVPVPVPEESKPEEKIEVSESVEKSEAPKTVESAPAPDVDSLPINGLKIEDAPEEVQPPVEEVPQPEDQKVEEAIATPETVAEIIEEKSAEIAEAEVCVEKESQVIGNVEVLPPPLPACPPPSSLTMFAESTMAPLVDTQVENLNVVNLDASVPSSVPAAVKDDVQSTESDSVPPLVCETNTVNISQSSLPSQEIVSEPTNASLPIIENLHLSESSSEQTVIEQSISVETSNQSPLVENVAVVSSNEILPPSPPATNDLPPPIEEELCNLREVDTFLPVDPPNPLNVKTDDLPLEPETSALTDTSSNADKLEVNAEIIPISNDIQLSPASEISKLEESDTNILNKEVSLPPVEEVVTSNLSTDSPVLQRIPSDQDVSETFAEPPSDSFPPPPPPESCPESITELSASESLPPPMSEFSVPDAILNSPTSETAELPCKEEAPLKDVKIPEVKDIPETDVAPKADPQETETAPVVNFLPPMEVPEAIALPVVEGAQQQLESSPVDTPQVKTVSEAVDSPPVTEAAVVESAPSGDSNAE